MSVFLKFNLLLLNKEKNSCINPTGQTKEQYTRPNKSVINILEDISMDYPNVICKLLFSHLIDIRQNSDDATLAVITIK